MEQANFKQVEKRLNINTQTSAQFKPEQEQKNAYGVQYGFNITKLKLKNTLYGLSSTEKLVYINLKLYTDREGHCWPSERLLAKDLGMDKNTISRNIRKLSERGFIRIEIEKGKGGKRYSYFIRKN